MGRDLIDRCLPMVEEAEAARAKELSKRVSVTALPSRKRSSRIQNQSVIREERERLLELRAAQAHEMAIAAERVRREKERERRKKARDAEERIRQDQIGTSGALAVHAQAASRLVTKSLFRWLVGCRQLSKSRVGILSAIVESQNEPNL